MAQLHIFEKYSIELLTSENTKQIATEEILAQKDELLSMIGEVLDQYIPNDKTIFIDRIALDLGSIPAADFYPEFISRIKQILHRELSVFIKQEDVQEYLQNYKEQPEFSPYFDLRKYLLYGFSEALQRDKDFDPERLIEKLIKENTASFREALVEFRKSPSALKRINKFSEQTRKDIHRFLELDEEFNLSPDEVRKMMFAILRISILEKNTNVGYDRYFLTSIEKMILFLSQRRDGEWNQFVEAIAGSPEAQSKIVELVSYKTLRMLLEGKVYFAKYAAIENFFDHVFSSGWKESLVAKRLLLEVSASLSDSSGYQYNILHFLEQISAKESIESSAVVKQFVTFSRKNQGLDFFANTTFVEKQYSEEAQPDPLSAILHFLHVGIWSYQGDTFDVAFKKNWLSQKQELLIAMERAFHAQEVRSRVAWHLDLVYVIEFSAFLFSKLENERWWLSFSKALVSESISPHHKETRNTFVLIFDFLHAHSDEHWTAGQIQYWMLLNSGQQEFLTRIFTSLAVDLKNSNFYHSDESEEFSLTYFVKSLFVSEGKKSEHPVKFANTEFSKRWTSVLSQPALLVSVLKDVPATNQEVWEEILLLLTEEQKEMLFEVVLPFQYEYFSQVRKEFFEIQAGSLQEFKAVKSYAALLHRSHKGSFQTDKKELVSHWLSVAVSGYTKEQKDILINAIKEHKKKGSYLANLEDSLRLVLLSFFESNAVPDAVLLLENVLTNEKFSSFSGTEYEQFLEKLEYVFEHASFEEVKANYPVLYLKLLGPGVLEMIEERISSRHKNYVAIFYEERVRKFPVRYSERHTELDLVLYVLTEKRLPEWLGESEQKAYNASVDYIKRKSEEILLQNPDEFKELLQSAELDNSHELVSFFAQFSKEEKKTLLNKQFSAQTGFMRLVSEFVSLLPFPEIHRAHESDVLFVKQYAFLVKFSDSFSATYYLEWYFDTLVSLAEGVSQEKFYSIVSEFIHTSPAKESHVFLVELIVENILPGKLSLGENTNDSDQTHPDSENTRILQLRTNSENTIERRIRYYFTNNSVLPELPVVSREQFFVEWKIWSRQNPVEQRILINEFFEQASYRKLFLRQADKSFIGFLIGTLSEASSYVNAWIESSITFLQNRYAKAEQEMVRFSVLFAVLDTVRNPARISVEVFADRLFFILNTDEVKHKISIDSITDAEFAGDLMLELKGDALSLDSGEEYIRSNVPENSFKTETDYSSVERIGIKPHLYTHYIFADVLLFFLKTGSFPEFSTINSLEELRAVVAGLDLSRLLSNYSFMRLLDNPESKTRMKSVSPEWLKSLEEKVSFKIEISTKTSVGVGDLSVRELLVESYIFWLQQGSAPWWYSETSAGNLYFAGIDVLEKEVLSNHLALLVSRMERSGEASIVLEILFKRISLPDFLKLINHSFNEVGGYVNVLFTLLIKAFDYAHVENSALFSWVYQFLRMNRSSFSSRRYAIGFFTRAIQINASDKKEFVHAIKEVLSEEAISEDFRYQIIQEVVLEFEKTNENSLPELSVLRSENKEESELRSVDLVRVLKDYIQYGTIVVSGFEYTFSREKFIEELAEFLIDGREPLRYELRELLFDRHVLERFVKRSDAAIRELIWRFLADSRVAEFDGWKKEFSHYFEVVFQQSSTLLVPVVDLVFFRAVLRKNLSLVFRKDIFEPLFETISQTKPLEDIALFIEQSSKYRDQNVLSETFKNVIEELELEYIQRTKRLLIQAFEEEQKRKSKPREEIIIKGLLPVKNAGVVLLGPYLFRYFDRLDMVADGKFKTDELALRGVQLLQYMITGQEDTPEHEMVLNKILCGVAADVVPENQISVTEEEREVTESLLWAVLQHWEILKSRSIEALREGFLIRDGMLEETDISYSVEVDRKAQDLLVDHIPWGFSTIKLPWMSKSLSVVWKKDIF